MNDLSEQDTVNSERSLPNICDLAEADGTSLNNHVAGHSLRYLRQVEVEASSAATLNEVVALMTTALNLPSDGLQSRARTQRIAYCRQMAMYLCRTLHPEISYPALGRFFGGRDHTTVMYAVRKIQKRIEHNAVLRKRVEWMLTELRGAGNSASKAA